MVNIGGHPDANNILPGCVFRTSSMSLLENVYKVVLSVFLSWIFSGSVGNSADQAGISAEWWRKLSLLSGNCHSL